MKLNKKTIIKISITIVLLAIALIIFFTVTSKEDNQSAGTIDFTLIDKEGKTIINELLDFTIEDNLISVLERNHQIRYENDIYGSKLLDIDTIKTDFKNTFLSIYVNDTFSTKGVSYIVLEDNMRIKIIEEVIISKTN